MIESRLPDLRRLLQCPDLQIRTDENWRAGDKNSRAAIREVVSDLTNEDLRDLEAPPRSERLSISISHCPLLGGFVYAPRPFALGFDIEVADRVNDSLVARLSRPEELRAAPAPGLLWVAKEAGFKSLLGPSQPRTLSQVIVGEWLMFGHPSELEKKSQAAWKFRISVAQSVSQTEIVSGQGIALSIPPFVFGLFCHKTST